MNKKLAIVGHPTRGKEVIELLKMMGGNAAAAKGFLETCCYYISEDITKNISWDYVGPKEIDEYKIFTLEEFLEKYPFKVGDKVFLYDNITEGCVTGMKWDEGTIKYCVYTSAEYWCDVKELLKWNHIDLVEKHYEKQYDEMNEIQPKRDIDKAEFMIKHMILPNKMDDKLEYEIIDGYEFDRVDNNKIILKPIKPKYPKTYKECCERVNACPTIGISYDSDEDMLYNDEVDLTCLTLRKLLICRNAYWKIAGEEMGLGKSWKPDWASGKPFYCISVSENIIGKGKWYTDNKILAFPTEEMRDAFFENFKDLIEECKEFL